MKVMNSRWTAILLLQVFSLISTPHLPLGMRIDSSAIKGIYNQPRVKESFCIIIFFSPNKVLKAINPEDVSPILLN